MRQQRTRHSCHLTSVSAAVQKQLGYYEPNYGTLFADREASNEERISRDRLLQRRAEAEIAFVLRYDLDREGLTIAHVMRAVEYAVCAIEIIDSRIAGWDIRAADSIADNASCGMYILGSRTRRINEVDLTLCGMVAGLNGQISSVGVGGASLGKSVDTTKALLTERPFSAPTPSVPPGTARLGLSLLYDALAVGIAAALVVHRLAIGSQVYAVRGVDASSGRP